MMSVHGANPVFFKKENKDLMSGTLTNPHPLNPITSRFCLTLPQLSPSHQSGRHTSITPNNSWKEFLGRKHITTYKI